MTCAVCGAALGGPVYTSSGRTSVTSLCELVPCATRVWACRQCTHVQTAEMADLAAYYDQAYRILVDSEEEDQLLALADGCRVFRVQHQLDTLLARVPLRRGVRVLDHGCAKAATMRALVASRPDVEVHLFDVSETYVPFWRRFLPEGRWATHAVRPEWAGTLDLVTSFFALEHVADPVAVLRDLARLLRPGGQVYLVVPNMYTNPADLVVLDHVNHFSAGSLAHALSRAGFREVAVAGDLHPGAWVVVATRGEQAAPEAPGSPDAAWREALDAIVDRWNGLSQRVRAFERDEAADGAVAIYGSGFYGTYLATCLAAPERIACFLDQNPHRQGKQLLGRPIVAPDALPPEVTALYVGLNPRVARQTIAELPGLQGRGLASFYV